MLTFLEFYSTMLRFVHFRLYHSALSPFCISLSAYPWSCCIRKGLVILSMACRQILSVV
jgi:hypothetical protein